MATCHPTLLQSTLNTQYDVEYGLAKQRRLFWRGSDEPQVGRWFFSCSSFSKFSNFVFFRKSSSFSCSRERGKGKGERVKKKLFFIFVPQSGRSLKISWRSFFRSDHCILPQVCEWWAKCEVIVLAGRGWGWGGVSVVWSLGHSGVRSRDRQLGFVTTVSPICLVSNRWVFWVVY